VTPIITGVTGTSSKSFRKYLRNMLGKHDVKELQQVATLDTEHIPQKVLM